jgi:dTDP-glucose pyrophosphorylase
MNIVIPMAGEGTRFKNAGYEQIKPLIPVNGKPMIQRAVESLKITGHYIFIIKRNNELKEFLKKTLPVSTIIEIDETTRGAAETVLYAKQYIDNYHPLIIANCDQIMHWNGSQFGDLCWSTNLDGIIVTYYKTSDRNSYARVSENGFVSEIKEKEVISNISLNGIHFWKRGEDFVWSAEEMLRLEDKAINGEYYIGPTYNHLIKKGRQIGIYHIPTSQHHAVGIPEDLEKYESLQRD